MTMCELSIAISLLGLMLAETSVAATAQPVQDGNIIRDASLDQYLEAHQQFAQQPVMPGSMPLIRTSAMTTQGQ